MRNLHLALDVSLGNFIHYWPLKICLIMQIFVLYILNICQTEDTWGILSGPHNLYWYNIIVGRNNT